MMIFKDKEVEVFEFNGRVLFNPYHCGDCLDLTESAVKNHLSKMNEKQAIILLDSDVRDKDIRKLNNAGEKFLTISGVYKLIFKSHKEDAEKFQDWVTDEVLPAIKKYGGYITPKKIEECHQNPEALIEMVNGLEEENSKLKTYIEANREHVEFAKNLNDREGTIGVAEETILLNQNGYNTTKLELFELFRSEKYLSRLSNGGHIPTQKSIDLNLFRIGYKTINHSNSDVDMIPVPLVTIPGQKYFFEKLLSKNADEQLSA